jgi:flavin-dependent dehydrogenase
MTRILHRCCHESNERRRTTVDGRDAETSSKTVFDVAIVGAGPAGAVTALLCARAGLITLILDRARFPRPKPCGDCLSPALTRVLERLGLLQFVLDADPARLAGWRIVSPGGTAFQGRFDDISSEPRVHDALAISRARLDATLLAQAERAGAQVLTNARVTAIKPASGTDETGRITGRHENQRFAVDARIIVGADGLRSVVAREIHAMRPRFRGLRKISLTAHVTGVRGAHPMGEMHLAEGLCVGIAPVNNRAAGITHARERDLAAAGIAIPVCGNDTHVRWAIREGSVPEWNVTLVADARRFGRSVARQPETFFREALRRFPALAGRLDDIQPVGPHGNGRDAWLLRSGPFDMPTRRTIAGNVALVGDAAGYYDPFTGQGIYQAITGAERLAQAIVAIVRGHVPRTIALRRYARELQRQARGPRFLQHAIEAVLSRPGVATNTVAWLAKRPGIVNALLAATGDLVPVRSLFEPRTLRALVSATQPRWHDDLR